MTVALGGSAGGQSWQEKRLEQLARFLEHDYESAARGVLREGLAEMFTLQRLQIPPSLHKCLGTTNIIESPQGGVQRRTDVTRWRDADMVQRWVASAWLLTEKHFRRIDGHASLWALAAILVKQKIKILFQRRTR
jgi:hypothetical protein